MRGPNAQRFGHHFSAQGIVLCGGPRLMETAPDTPENENMHA